MEEGSTCLLVALVKRHRRGPTCSQLRTADVRGSGLDVHMLAIQGLL